MNKFSKITGLVAVLAAALILGVVVTGVSAQSPATPDSTGGVGQMQRGNDAGTGLGVMAVDKTDMHAVISDVLGLSPEALETAFADGKTLATLTQELGVDQAYVQAAMEAAHVETLQQAADDGLITQEQADWILSHHGGQNGQGNGLRSSGIGEGPADRIDRGPGGNAGSGGYGGNCIYETS